MNTTKTTTPTVDAIGKIDLTGNVTPNAWFHHIKTESGKVDLPAIVILADIVYWYRPAIERDEATGEVTQVRRKFRADKLQKSYQQLAKQFGLTKKRAREAVKNLERLGLISTELRNVTTETGLALSNVLFIEPISEAISVVSHTYTTTCSGVPQTNGGTNHNMQGVYPKKVYTPPLKRYTPPPQKGIDLPPKKGGTYTETTTKITTDKNKEIKQKDFPAKPEKNCLTTDCVDLKNVEVQESTQSVSDDLPAGLLEYTELLDSCGLSEAGVEAIFEVDGKYAMSKWGKVDWVRLTKWWEDAGKDYVRLWARYCLAYFAEYGRFPSKSQCEKVNKHNVVAILGEISGHSDTTCAGGSRQVILRYLAGWFRETPVRFAKFSTFVKVENWHNWRDGRYEKA